MSLQSCDSLKTMKIVIVKLTDDVCSLIIIVLRTNVCEKNVIIDVEMKGIVRTQSPFTIPVFMFYIQNDRPARILHTLLL